MRNTLSLVVMLLGCGADEPSADASIWEPYAATENIAGRSLDEWAVEWNRWTYAQTSCDSPWTDIDGSQCGLYQDEDSPVFFLTFAPSETPRSKCKLPSDKFIFVPVITVTVDNVGEEPPLEAEELERDAMDGLESMRDQMLVVDGSSFPMEEHVVAPIKHTALLPAAPNYYTCQGVEGYENLTLDPVYVAGYFALLPPPGPGKHTLSYAGAQDIYGVSQVSQANMQLTVDTL